jgi:WhiB family transcriptional regulator, redox-sensing transcriptional regulator
MTLVPFPNLPIALPAPGASHAPTWSRDWAARGRCSGQDPDALFVEGREQRAAKAVCKGCPVVAECLADALDNRTPFGVWGGMTERERRALLRARPDVSDWGALLRSLREADTASRVS